MLGELFRKRASRKQRVAAVHDMVDAMNALDYDAFRKVMSPDAVIVDAGGRKLEGIEAIVAGDRAFREQADHPQILIDSLDHIREEVLVRGHMTSELPEIDGPLMWRIEFDGTAISRVEVTRPANLMSAPRHAAQNASQTAA